MQPLANTITTFSLSKKHQHHHLSLMVTVAKVTTPVRGVMNHDRRFAASGDTANRDARLPQLVPLGQLLALQYNLCCQSSKRTFKGEHLSVNTLRKVKRLTKYQASTTRGDLGPPSTSAHWSAWRTKVSSKSAWRTTVYLFKPTRVPAKVSLFKKCLRRESESEKEDCCW